MNPWYIRWHEFLDGLGNVHAYLPRDSFLHATHISLQHRYLYVETPKVACSSIKRMLIQAELGERVEFTDFEHIHYRDFWPLLNAQQVGDFGKFLQRPDLFTFCFVRNPYERLLSAYLDKILPGKAQAEPLWIQLGYSELEKPSLSFAQFVAAVVAQPIMHMDAHWRTQYYQTCQAGISYDFVGRFERFEADLAQVIHRIGGNLSEYYEATRPHSTQASKRLADFYTPALQEQVYQKFQQDFVKFGYARELPRT